MRQIEVNLDWKEDKKGNKFLFGKFRGPFTIDAKDGICFLIWANEIDPLLAIKGEKDRSKKFQSKEDVERIEPRDDDRSYSIEDERP